MSYRHHYPSPNGLYYILTVDNEMRMSHWVASAALWQTGKNQSLLEVGNSLWDASEIGWEADSSAVTLTLRRYPGDCPTLKLVLFPERKLAEIATTEDRATVDFAALGSALESYYKAKSSNTGGGDKR